VLSFCLFHFFGERHISLRGDPRFRRNSAPLFSAAVSARRFIILFLHRDRFSAVERNARARARERESCLVEIYEDSA